MQLNFHTQNDKTKQINKLRTEMFNNEAEIHQFPLIWY